PKLVSGRCIPHPLFAIPTSHSPRILERSSEMSANTMLKITQAAVVSAALMLLPVSGTAQSSRHAGSSASQSSNPNSGNQATPPSGQNTANPSDHGAAADQTANSPNSPNDANNPSNPNAAGPPAASDTNA